MIDAFFSWLAHLFDRAVFAVLMQFVGKPDRAWTEQD